MNTVGALANCGIPEARHNVESTSKRGIARPHAVGDCIETERRSGLTLEVCGGSALLSPAGAG